MDSPRTALTPNGIGVKNCSLGGEAGLLDFTNASIRC